jgi:hypothetical protein
MTRALTALAATLLLTACAAFTPPNLQLAKYEKDAGYSFKSLEGDDAANKLFVIVTFSGGGTRAAAFAYGVLEALRDTTVVQRAGPVNLLDEVDVISSVSGGSFTAAYYALRGRRIFEEFPALFLNRPVQSELIGEALWPPNWLKLVAPSYGRSDLAAEFYDRELFKGATYAELIARKQRPFVIINATDMTSGAPFPFIQDQFDLLCSDLAGVTLAHAVAASSAFPGALTPLTFKNFAGRCEYRQPPWVQHAMDDHPLRTNPSRTASARNRLSLAAEVQVDGAPPGAATRPARPYIHLTDGGVADNIGLRGPLGALSSLNHPWSVLRMMANKQVNRLVVIAVNAATAPPVKRDDSASVPGLIDTVFTAADVPLGNYSFDTMELLARMVNDFDKDDRLLTQCNELSAAKGAQCALNLPAAHKVDFYPVQVAFEYITSQEDRVWFQSLPTTFQLPPETVVKLRAMGRRLLFEDPKFRKLLEDLKAE